MLPHTPHPSLLGGSPRCNGHWNCWPDTAAKLVERNLDEHTTMGGAAAIFSIGGSPWTQSRWTIGSELTQFDVDAAALAKAVEVLVSFYCSDGAPPPPFVHLFTYFFVECDVGGEKPTVS